MQAQHVKHTKQSRYRERLRAQGLRPVQLWLPDTTKPGFAAECRHQAQLIATAHETEILDWVTAAAEATEGWTE